MRRKIGLSNELNFLVLGMMFLLAAVLTTISVTTTVNMLSESTKEAEYAYTQRMVEQSLNIYNKGWIAVNSVSGQVTNLMKHPVAERDREELNTTAPIATARLT